QLNHRQGGRDTRPTPVGVAVRSCRDSTELVLLIITSPISGWRARTSGEAFGRTGDVVATFTPTQGRYLAFIHAYTCLHGYPPAEADIAAAMCVSPPSVNQMVKTLERKGLVLRHPRTAPVVAGAGSGRPDSGLEQAHVGAAYR